MRKNKPSIDGFISRPSGRSIGRPSRSSVSIGESRPERDISQQSFDQNTIRRPLSVPRSEIDESLRDIDEPDDGKKRRRRKQRNKKPVSSRKKIAKRTFIALAIIIICMAGYIGAKALLAGGNMFQGSLFDVFQAQPLKMDEKGRSNILVFGTSEDDPEHPGGALTDSIMVMSIDQNKKNAYLISIPRDLQIEYGEGCPEGYQGKINSMYACFSEDGDKESDGANALKDKVGSILGIDIQYYAHLNYSVVKESVDAVGGVDIKIESEDPRGILDRNFDWKCNYKCYYVNYKNGEVAHMDGEHALAFSRARNAAGGYGLPAGNFDREKNQQKVIKALREKAVSAGTLTNVGKVTSLIDAFGSNLRTSFETKEIRTLMSLGTDITSSKIKSISLVEEGNMVVTTDNIGGSSIVRPVAGLYDYSEIQTFVNKQLNATEITKEAANIVVLNGSGTGGVAQVEADKLEKKGFTISFVDNAPAGTYSDVEIYQIGDGKTATKAKLKELFSVKTVKITSPPIAVAADVDFVVIFGKSRSSNN